MKSPNLETSQKALGVEVNFSLTDLTVKCLYIWSKRRRVHMHNINASVGGKKMKMNITLEGSKPL